MNPVQRIQPCHPNSYKKIQAILLDGFVQEQMTILMLEHRTTSCHPLYSYPRGPKLGMLQVVQENWNQNFQMTGIRDLHVIQTSSFTRKLYSLAKHLSQRLWKDPHYGYVVEGCQNLLNWKMGQVMWYLSRCHFSQSYTQNTSREKKFQQNILGNYGSRVWNWETEQ